MSARLAKQEDREQAREGVNVLRILGGLLLAVALMLFFFHLAERPMGHFILGWLAALFTLAGVVLIAIGSRKLRALH